MGRVQILIAYYYYSQCYDILKSILRDTTGIDISMFGGYYSQIKLVS